MSEDYHLLKHSESGTIVYTIPSEVYHNELMLTDSWNEERFQLIKADLLSRKKDKVVVYNSFSELQNILCSHFNFTIKF